MSLGRGHGPPSRGLAGNGRFNGLLVSFVLGVRSAVHLTHHRHGDSCGAVPDPGNGRDGCSRRLRPDELVAWRVSSSGFVVGAWAYLIGTGNISTIWPMFARRISCSGRSSALDRATTVLIKMWKSQYLGVTGWRRGLSWGGSRWPARYEMFWNVHDEAGDAHGRSPGFHALS